MPDPGSRRLSIWAIGTTRDEVDVIGVNVRHHLAQGVDRFVVVDDGSTDGTPEALEELSRLVPLVWQRHDGSFHQQQLLTSLAQQAFIAGADWVIPIDADEFWYAPNGTLREVLARSSAGALQVPVINFVQAREQLEPSPDGLLTMTRRVEVPAVLPAAIRMINAGEIAFVEHAYPPKWIARTCSTLQIGWGNHQLFGAAGSLEFTGEIICLHAPLRSKATLARKAQATRADRDVTDYLAQAWHIKRWQDLARAGALDAEWQANSYGHDARLGRQGAPALVADTRIRELVLPWLAPDGAGRPPAAAAHRPESGDGDADAADRRSRIISDLTAELDRQREALAQSRRDVDRHGLMIQQLLADNDVLRRIVDTARPRSGSPDDRRVDEAPLGTEGALAALRRELDYERHVTRALRASASWRVTSPLRRTLDALIWIRNRLMRPRPAAAAATEPAGEAERSIPVLPSPRASIASHSNHLLIITDAVPTPDRDSGSLRLVEIMMLLAGMGHTVTLLADQPSAASADCVDSLAQSGVTVIVGGAGEHLADHGARYRYVMMSRPDAAFRHLFAVRAHCLRATVVYDTVDLHAVRLRLGFEVEGAPELLRQSREYERIEQFNAFGSDAVIAVSEIERQVLSTANPGVRTAVLPNVHVCAASTTPWDTRRDLLFIGGFLHRPNVDAVTYFVEQVLPRIRHDLPDVQFRILGSHMPDRITALSSPGIQAIGYVANPAPHFNSSRVFVAPIRYGAGTKGKVGQSLSFGLPVVTTTAGAEGLMLEHGRHALIADGADAFARAVVDLYNDEPLWTRLSRAGVEHIEAHFSRTTARRTLETIFPLSGGAGQ